MHQGEGEGMGTENIRTRSLKREGMDLLRIWRNTIWLQCRALQRDWSEGDNMGVGTW